MFYKNSYKFIFSGPKRTPQTVSFYTPLYRFRSQTTTVLRWGLLALKRRQTDVRTDGWPVIKTLAIAHFFFELDTLKIWFCFNITSIWLIPTLIFNNLNDSLHSLGLKKHVQKMIHVYTYICTYAYKKQWPAIKIDRHCFSDIVYRVLWCTEVNFFSTLKLN